MTTLSKQQKNILIDLLAEVHSEGYFLEEQDWPEVGHNLIAVSIGDEIMANENANRGVIGLLTIHSPLPVAKSEARDSPSSSLEGWQQIGDSLQVHNRQPDVQVYRPSPTAPDTFIWQAYSLNSGGETVLHYLLNHPGEVQPAEELFAVAWPDEAYADFGLRADQKDRLRRLIYQLRQRIEPVPGKPIYLRTVRATGYIFYAEIETHE